MPDRAGKLVVSSGVASLRGAGKQPPRSGAARPHIPRGRPRQESYRPRRTPSPGAGGGAGLALRSAVMDLRRLRAGEWIAAVCGAGLLVSLWLPWYSGEAAGSAALSAWEALGALDVILALISAAAVGLLIVTAAQYVPAVPLAMSVFVAFAGLLGVLLVLIRLLSLPAGAEGRDWALWLALACTLGIVAGSLIAMRDERPSPDGGHTDVTGRPGRAPAEIETFPAPRP